MSYRTCRSDKVMVKRNTVSVIARACIQEYVCMYVCTSPASSATPRPIADQSKPALPRALDDTYLRTKDLLRIFYSDEGMRPDRPVQKCGQKWHGHVCFPSSLTHEGDVFQA